MASFSLLLLLFNFFLNGLSKSSSSHDELLFLQVSLVSFDPPFPLLPAKLGCVGGMYSMCVCVCACVLQPAAEAQEDGPNRPVGPASQPPGRSNLHPKLLSRLTPEANGSITRPEHPQVDFLSDYDPSNEERTARECRFMEPRCCSNTKPGRLPPAGEGYCIIEECWSGAADVVIAVTAALIPNINAQGADEGCRHGEFPETVNCQENNSD